MTQKRLQLGKHGEEATVKYIKKQGYRILEKNFRTKTGEIDIIAEDKKVVAFIEVKTRTGDQFGEPLEAVGPTKQKKIARVADQFLMRHKVENRDCRFDIVSITCPTDDPQTWQIELIKDAFKV